MKSNFGPFCSLPEGIKPLVLALSLMLLNSCGTPGARLDRDSNVHRKVAYARACAPFAAMSALAYKPTQKYPECQVFLEDYLKKTGWTRIDEFKPTDRAQGLGMSYEVWKNNGYNPPVVVIAFRGTEPLDIKDWRDNLWWITRFFTRKDNQYRCAPEPEEAGKVITEYRNKNVIILTTGHSLGGGLAQAVRYAFPTNVAQCYAFDSSPVTGHVGDHGKEKGQADADRRVARELLPIPAFPSHRTLRVYERGEILAYLRAQARFLHPINEKIVEIRWNFSEKGNSISQHSMWTFATNIVDTASKSVVPPLPAEYRPWWQKSASARAP